MSSVITQIQNLSFQFLNVVFGKSTIFVVILGWVLVVFGLLFLVNPDTMRSKIVSKGFGIVKLITLAVAFFLWGVVSKWSRQFSGGVQMLVFWGGLAALVFLFFRSRAAAKQQLNALVERLPVKVLIAGAWLQVVIGGLMVYFRRRLW